MKRAIFIILPIVALLLSGCSIDIKSNKEIQQERTKKQEVNNTISGLNQQISGLEQTLIGLNQEIDLLQPKDNSGNDQMFSGLYLSGLDLTDSTGIIKAINALDEQPITGSQLNWLEKFFNRFKELFNGGNKQVIGQQLSGLASTGLESEGTGINTVNATKTGESSLPKMEVKKKTYTPNSEATIKCQEKFGKNSYNGTTKSAGYGITIDGGLCFCKEGYAWHAFTSCITRLQQCQDDLGIGGEPIGDLSPGEMNRCHCKTGYKYEDGKGCVKT